VYKKKFITDGKHSSAISTEGLEKVEKVRKSVKRKLEVSLCQEIPSPQKEQKLEPEVNM